ncbi:unnamed protein product [Prunus armeniaca]
MVFEDTLDTPTTTAKSSASKTSKTPDMAQPIITVRNDTFDAPFTIWLNEKNYSTWSKMLLGKKRLSDREGGSSGGRRFEL